MMTEETPLVRLAWKLNTFLAKYDILCYLLKGKCWFVRRNDTILGEYNF